MKKIFCIFAIPLLVTGCAIDKEVSSVSGTVYGYLFGDSPEGKTFYVIQKPKGSTVDAGLKPNEYERTVINALEKKGYKLVSPSDHPALAIQISESILLLGEAKGRSTPTVTQVGAASYSSYATPLVKTYMIRFEVQALDPISLSNGQQKAYWNISSEYIGRRNNMDAVTPYLVEAVGPWLGREANFKEKFSFDRK